MDCLFCKIANGAIPAQIVYEDKESLAFLDIHPLALGHLVVVSKSHAENLLDLPDNKVGPLFLAVKYLTGVLKKAFNPDGFTIGINHGKVSGQAIDHLHVHIIPRFANDGGKSLHSVVNNPPKDSLEEIAKKVKKYVGS